MNKRNKILVVIFILIFLLITLFLIRNNVYKKDKEIKPVINHDDVIEEVISDIPIINYKEEIDNLITEYNNDDIKGILTIENTSFNEIVVQADDNDYYLKHTISHESNWRGQTFLDYRVDINDSKKLLIYGHSATNHDIPFNVFENYYSEDYYKEHKYMYLQTDESKKIYEIFSVYVEVEDWSYYSRVNYIDEDDYYGHITSFKNNSWYDTGVNLTKDDEILIIQTCSNHPDYAKYDNKFLLVMGKRIKEFDK